MSDPTEDMIKREVAAAAKILREDGHSVRLAAIEAKLAKQFPDEPEPGSGEPPADDGKPKAPPKKDAPAPSGGGKRPGLWWGDAVDG
jgi:hypothetical protein